MKRLALTLALLSALSCPAQDKDAGGDLKPTATLRLNSVIRGLHLSKDGQFLYALDLLEAKLYKIDSATLKVAQEIALPDNSRAMCVTPDESKVYVAAMVRPPSVTEVNGGTRVNHGSGVLLTISPKEFRVVSKIEISIDPYNIQATDHGLLVATGPYQVQYALVIDLANAGKGEGAELKFPGEGIQLAADQSRVYAKIGGFLLLHKDPRMGWVSGCGPMSRELNDSTEGDFGVSPDGRFFIHPSGTIGAVAINPNADLRTVGHIKPFLCIAMASGSDLFYVGNEDGVVTEYTFGKFEQKRSFKSGLRCTCLALDGKRSVLYAHVTPTQKEYRPQVWNGSTIGVGDIVAWSLSRK